MKYLKLFEDYTEDKIVCHYCDDVLKPEDENETWEKLGSKSKTPVCIECIKDYTERRGEKPMFENDNYKCELCDESIIDGKYCKDCEEIYNEASAELKRNSYFKAEEEAGNNYENNKLKFNRKRTQADFFNKHIDPTLQVLGDSIALEIDNSFKCILNKSVENNVVYVYFKPEHVNIRNSSIVININQNGYKIEKGEEFLSKIERKLERFITKIKQLEIV